jgi:hypothetical protein
MSRVENRADCWPRAHGITVAPLNCAALSGR